MFLKDRFRKKIEKEHMTFYKKNIEKGKLIRSKDLLRKSSKSHEGQELKNEHISPKIQVKTEEGSVYLGRKE